MAKPDNRADNVERLQSIVDHTVQNLEESKDYVQAHKDHMSQEQLQDIQAKNARREQSLEGLRGELRDEATDQSQLNS
ncbi:small acid-soluble spore protein Tlp [Marinicrinis lubricantis]|uniref:Small acid-soluble spore protein Tlp n=1 Tax=Marinicrinis lubricantis TaxID=2086470 RepID=A0ABW1ITJ5_9BACL